MPLPQKDFHLVWQKAAQIVKSPYTGILSQYIFSIYARAVLEAFFGIQIWRKW
jgi:hypothetical protein